ncbi:ATP-dependent RNA helicase dbp7 [Borealophlyctis nickersoniae]|nr:ATP-dependent RNA helicase dbp7 [Borealophlyctis nickersoniae]
MDDDSLMLNFAAGPPASTPPTRPKVSRVAAELKGSWRMRRKAAKKIVKSVKVAEKKPETGAAPGKHTANGGGGGNGLVPSSAGGLVNGGEADAAESGRSKPPSAGTKRKSDAAFNSSGGAGSGPAGKKRQIVSSLFSSNPDMPVSFAIPTPTAPPVPIAPALPTFAATTFEGCGLDQILCSHLSSKMSVTKPTPIQRASLPSLLRPGERDTVLQAQTGSGKTLAFLLPIVHRLIKAEEEFVHSPENLSRGLGTLAIILAPTRELAKQIESVLIQLLQYRRSTKSGEEKEGESPKHRHWIVPGIVIGGESKQSEKARLRKGVNILVATPGRLLDHLQTTQSFDTGNLRWLVLDEADNLLELGFEETLRDILRLLGERRKAAVAAGYRMRVNAWPAGRQTILCSATMREGIQRLAEETLDNPEFVRADGKAAKSKEPTIPSGQKDEGMDVKDAAKEADGGKVNGEANASTKAEKKVDAKTKAEKKAAAALAEQDTQHTVPVQLKQTYIVSPAKMRLVTLAALLRTLTKSDRPCKVIVFTSCCDSVDFHYHVLANGHKAPARHPDKEEEEGDKESSDEIDGNEDKEGKSRNQLSESTPRGSALAPVDKNHLQTAGAETPLLPSALLFKLHGNLPQAARAAAYKTFCATTRPAILICTDVAARGLDLPDVTDIIQYDPPGDVKDYVHRIGRTARLGREGQAVLVLLPGEVEYLDVLRKRGLVAEEMKLDKVLGVFADAQMEGKKAVTGKKGKEQRKKEFEKALMDVQMQFERFVLADLLNVELSEKAFTSHIRAYATHVAPERHIFHVRKLHLGHVAKSFALREAPSGLAAAGVGGKKENQKGKDNKPDVKKVGAGMYKRKAAMIVASTSEFGDGGVKEMNAKRGKKSK